MLYICLNSARFFSAVIISLAILLYADALMEISDIGSIKRIIGRVGREGVEASLGTEGLGLIICISDKLYGIVR